jgi:nucleoside 2-deoxyribosyltransferase
MIEIKAPNKLKKIKGSKTVFLAGSIDMGKAIDWQKQVKEAFEKNKKVTFWNPRREDFDPDAKQDKSNAYFYEQVTWELNALEKADIIIYCFDPKGQAPITLLELGLHVKSGKPVIVCCPEGYWRKGNVDIVCEKYKIQQADTIEDLIEKLKELI